MQDSHDTDCSWMLSKGKVGVCVVCVKFGVFFLHFSLFVNHSRIGKIAHQGSKASLLDGDSSSC